MKRIILLLILCIPLFSSYAEADSLTEKVFVEKKSGIPKKLKQEELKIVPFSSKSLLFSHQQKVQELKEYSKEQTEKIRNERSMSQRMVKIRAEVQKERLDSLVYVGHDGYKEKKEFTFYENQWPFKDILSVWNPQTSAYEKFEEYTFEWDEDGYLLIKTSFSYEYNEGVKEEFTYNDQKLGDSETISAFLEGNWVYQRKNLYQYDANGNMTEIISYEYNGDWKAERKTSYSYDQRGNMTEIVISEYNTGWVNVSKEIAEYDGKNRQIRYEGYEWKNGEWVGLDKEEYAYLPNSEFQILWLIYVWDVDSRQWVYDNKVEQEFENGNIILQQESFWNPEANEWIGGIWRSGELLQNGKTIFTYDDRGREISQIFSKLEGNEWMNKVAMETTWSVLETDEVQSNRKAYTYSSNEAREYNQDLIYRYDSFGNKTYAIEKHKIEGVWQSLYEEIYVYDSAGNETESWYWKYENNVKLADIAELTKYENGNIIESLYYGGQNTDEDDWIETAKFHYEYESNVMTRKYRFKFENKQWIADWGEGADWDFTKPSSEIIHFYVPGSNYKVLFDYNYVGTGTDENFNANITTYYYSLQTVVGINKEKNADILYIYPNPVADWVHINSNEDVKVNVYSLEGSRLLQTTDKEINMSTFTPGIYIIEVNGVKTKVVKK